MAEFCYDCVRTVFPEADPRRNDLTHGDKGVVVWEVCEGCGPGWFDWQGRRVQVDEPPPAGPPSDDTPPQKGA